ncbi:MAG: FtsX-like permease family protein [Acidimicrobiia bacterium]
MGAVRMCARSLLRRRVWGTVAVVLLVGIAGGAVLAALAGSRRTESAYGRLLDATSAADVMVGTQGFGSVSAARVAELPQVARAGRVVAFGLAPRPKHASRPGPDDFAGVFGMASADGVAGYEIDRFRLLEGRLPRRDRPNEVLVNELAAEQLHLRSGDVFHGWVWSYLELLTKSNELEAEGREPTDAELRQVFVPVDLTVVGVGRPRGDLLVNENQDQAGMLLTPAFARRFADRVSYEGALVDLKDPRRDLASFAAALRREFPDVSLDLRSADSDAATFSRVASPYVDALQLFALVAAIAGFLVVGQALARMVTADAVDGPNLSALGATRAQRALVASARALAAVLIGIVSAVVLAWAASPIFPLGRARLAEPSPGFRFDTLTVGVGVLGAALLIALVALTAWRSALAPNEDTTVARRRQSRVADRLAAAGAATSLVNGVRFAVQRDRASGSTSLATAVFGLVAAIATIGAALVFATNLDSLVTQPARYGWRWDALLDTYDVGATSDLVAQLRDDGDLVGLTIGARASLVLDGHTVSAFGFDRVRGGALPNVPAGRWPHSPNEIALGVETLRVLGKSVGDTVVTRSPDGALVRLRVVGRTTLPSLSLNGTFGLGEGAALTADGLRVLDPAAEPTFFLVNLAPGVAVSTVNRRYGDIASALGPQRPADIQSYARVRPTPLVLSGLLAVLGIGVLAHLLFTSVRGRRRDLAILKTIGCSRRQVATTVAWQATTLVGTALVIGIPTGIVAGRWVWRSFANDLGVSSTVLLPPLGLVLLASVAILVANVIAAIPARVAARTRPAVVLRSE